MPKFSRADKDAVNAVITVTLEKSDYESKFNAELAKYKKQAQLKGFRKGKTPDGVIRKMYGKNLLSEIINEELQAALFGYIDEQKIDFLGQPLSSEDHEDITFDPNNLRTFNFKFDLGLVPQFELKGISSSDTYNYYEIEVDETLLDQEIQNASRKKGVLEDTDLIGEDHTVTLQLDELEGSAVKAEGISHEVKVFTGSLTESAMKALKGKKVDDVIAVNPFELEKDTTETNARKYLLGLEDGDEREVNSTFQATVKQVQHLAPAPIDQALFDEMFGEGVVEGEAGAKDYMRNDLAEYHAQRSDYMLLMDAQEALLKLHQFELPDEFLKRWLRIANEKMTTQRLEEGFDNFKDSLRWSVIRNRISQQLGVAVTEEEVKSTLANRMARMYKQYGLPDDLIEKLMDRMVEENHKQLDEVRQELVSNKLAAAIRNAVSLNKIKLSSEDFVKMEQEKVAALKAAAGASLLDEGADDGAEFGEEE